MTRAVYSVIYLCLAAALVSGQSLTEVAKREKERRKRTEAAETVIDDSVLRRGELPSSPSSDDDDEVGDEGKEEKTAATREGDGLSCEARVERIAEKLESLEARFLRGTGEVPCETYMERPADFPQEARECGELEEEIRTTRKAKADAARCLNP